VEDYNPFSGTPSIDFDAVDKKSKEAAPVKQAAPTAVEPAPTAVEEVEDYSPFAGNTNLYAPSAAASPPIQGANGAQFGLSSGSSGGRASASQKQKPSARRPSSPMGYNHGPVGLDGNPLPQSNAVARPAPSPYGAPAPSPYGAPPAYSSPPPAYGAPMGGGASAHGSAPVGLDGNPIPGGYSAPPQQGMGGAPPPAYGAPPQYGAAPAAAYGAPGYAPPMPGYGAPQGAWPPPPGSAGSYGLGMRPPQIDNLKWNWGAFLLPVFWAWAYGVQPWAWRMTIFVVLACFGRFGIIGSILFIAGSFYLGLNGHSLAWQNKNHDSYEHFIGVQRKWLYAGLAVHAVVWLGVIIASATLVATLSTAFGHGSVPSYTSPAVTPGSGTDNGDGAPAPTGGEPTSTYTAPAPGGGDTGSAGAYGIGGDSGAAGGADGEGAGGGFHPKN